ncbi:PREDICTED: LOW QUALITY PROTEIN: UDP-glycosyltransferase 89A2 [Tarenaya hassleriana]|uniref:LOW QUALITY PROTEIN: UDP-glycosyltransferase 89A2 n=1 Tax=Tarenaya hassleriana TaxID=28532 RepID=UPI00053C6CCC|nr:PREDICTED: LOW QUALITY PROTEIN: UDP-glycosyltransferase 89A2 [Tarenaya hassleriana]
MIKWTGDVVNAYSLVLFSFSFCFENILTEKSVFSSKNHKQINKAQEKLFSPALDSSTKPITATALHAPPQNAGEMTPETRPGNSKPHIVVFPYPAQGHMLPLLDLTHQLCRRGLAVSVVVTTGNLRFLSPLLSAHSSESISAVSFPFPPHPSLPSGVENVQDVGNSGNYPIMASLRELREPIINWFRAHPNPPVAFVSDFFLGWTNDLCRQIGIPRFAFFSSGALLAAVVKFCFDNIDLVKSTEPIRFLDLPRTPVFKKEHIPTTVRRYIHSPSPELEIARNSYLENILSYGCVFNSFDCLEDEYFEYMKQKVGHDRVFGVGPLCSVGLDPSGRGKSGSDSVSDVDTKALLTWLDQCPDGSVVYVSFGSQKLLTKDQCNALALGLEKSMTRFVWVVKKDPVPDGFEGRVAGRGMVVRGWAPQVVLLRHMAVGGFLSHCGWNSVLEAITSETMIMAWPWGAMNAKLVVDHMGIAVRACEGTETVPDPDELGRTIQAAMGNDGKEVRSRAAEIGKRAVKAVEPGGSSWTAFDHLVQELLHL